MRCVQQPTDAFMADHSVAFRSATQELLGNMQRDICAYSLVRWAAPFRLRRQPISSIQLRILLYSLAGSPANHQLAGFSLLDHV